MMGRLAAALCVLAVMGFAMMTLPARAASIPLFSGPQDNSQLFSYLNSLVININAILTPLLPTVPGSVNAVSLTPGVTGTAAMIGLQPGGDTNASLQINASGTGNVILLAGSGETGVLQIANSSSFVPAQGLGTCPSVSTGITRPLGVNQTIQGFMVMQDWLGRNRYLPAC